MFAKLYSLVPASAVLARAADYSVREIREFSAFLARPHRARRKSSTAGEQIGRVMFFTVAVLVVTLPLGMLLDVLEAAAGIKYKMPLGQNLFADILAIAVLAPVFEELLFRAGMRKPVWCLMIIPLLSIGALTSSVAGVALLLGVASVLAAILFALARRAARAQHRRFGVARQFVGRYPQIFYLNSFLFAAAHVSTFEHAGMQAAIVLILVLPMAIGACVLGYLRIRDGLRSSMLLHALNNLVAVGLFWIGMH